MTKLYNFRIIEGWDGYHPERLHRANGLVRRLLNETYEWEDSPFRCLHVCFLRRSSRERARPRAVRESPGDLYSRPHRRPVRLVRRLRAAAGFPPRSHKHEHYRLGPLVTVLAAPFL